MDIRAGFRQRQEDQRRAMESRIQRSLDRHAAEDADRRTPVERLADAVNRPAGPPSTNEPFNRAVRRLARNTEGDEE